MALQNFIDNSLPVISAAWLNAVDLIKNVVTGASGGITVAGTVDTAAGTVALPAITLAADLDSGLYQIGANNLGVAVAGAKVLDISAVGLGIVGDVSVSTKTPASAAAAGVAGTITWDSSYLYVCVATNTWKRVAIATWP